MTWIEKLNLNSHLASNANTTMTQFVLLGLLLLTIFIVMCVHDYAKGEGTSEGYTLYVTITLIPAILVFILACFQTPSSYVVTRADKTLAKNVMLQNSDDTTIKQKDVVYAFNDKTQKLAVIRTNWNDGNEKLVIVNADIKRQENVYRADSKIGKAYLKVGAYISEHYTKPINVKWTVKPYKAEASFDDESGHRKVVCYINNQNINSNGDLTVIKY